MYSQRKNCDLQCKSFYLTFLFLLAFIPFGINAQVVNHNPSHKNFYEQGLQLKNDGQTKAALNKWLEAKGQLTGTDIDPRIGFAFIDLVTEQELKKYYKIASRMYFWALSGGVLVHHTKSVVEELKRIKPLLNQKEYNRWKEYIRDGDQTGLHAIKRFWGNLDPTTSTPVNERLLEHWERIQYVRAHFTKNESTVYPSDERGEVYVKYGLPDESRDGVFQFNSFQVEAWAQDILLVTQRFGNTVIDGSTTASTTLTSGISSFADTKEQLTAAARDYFSYPDYEIWTYRRLKNENENQNLIFIFGEASDSGEFGLRSSLGEFIPNRAYNSSSGIKAGSASPASPGLLLQLMLYEQVAAVDPFFGNALVDLETVAINSTGRSSYRGFSERAKNEQALERVQSLAPPQESAYLRQLPKIELDIRQYRLLNEENQPIFATYLYSYPVSVLLADYGANAATTSPSDYKLTHSIQLRDSAWTLRAHVPDKPKLLLNKDKDNNYAPVQSLFLIPYLKGNARQIFSAELHNKTIREDSISAITIMPAALRAVGKRVADQPEPLSTDPDHLAISDLIIGYAGSVKNQKIPFYVPPEPVIPQGNDLMFHFEAYHLQPGPEGVAEFQVVYELKKDGNFVQKLFSSGQQQGRLTLNFETDSDRFVENIEVETSELEAGSYELILTIKEPSTRRSIERKIEFEIVQ
jgi:GWxTD domain-containing protein